MAFKTGNGAEQTNIPALIANSVLYTDALGNITSNTNKIYYSEVTERFGLNTNTPDARFEIENSQTLALPGIKITNTAAQDAQIGGLLYIYEKAGTAMLQFAALGGVHFGGQTATSENTGVVIRAQADENWTDVANGSYLQILTTANGAIVPALCATFESTRRVTFQNGIRVFSGIVDAQAGLTVAGTTTLAALTGVLKGAAGVVSAVAVLPIADGGTNNGSLAVTNGGVTYTDGTRLQNTGAGTSGQYLKSVGAGAPVWRSSTPTVQRFLSGSGTYTTPTNCSYIKVRMVGAGSGGNGGGDGGTGGSATAGGATTFGTSLLTANGGAAGVISDGSAGGAVTVNAPAISLVALTGGYGSSVDFYNSNAIANTAGASGGVSFFGGAGCGSAAGAGIAAIANSGSGGGGGGGNSVAGVVSGGGGGAGGYIEAIIVSPSASYAYAVGAGSAGGAAGTNGNAGGAGGSGIIIVEEYY